MCSDNSYRLENVFYEGESRMETIMNADTLAQIVKEEAAIILFTAENCDASKKIEPILPRIVADFPSFNFYEIDCTHVDVCTKYNVTDTPCFLAFNQGEELTRLIGSDLNEIEQFLSKAEALLS